ncbi:MAG: FAD-dependent oxidoreductase [Pseudomonadota bacterium]
MTGDIAIVGAGVAGLCLAAECADRGISVSLFDREPAVGPHACSWWAGGMLAPFCEGESAEEPVVRLGQEAADWWARMGVPVTRRGSLVVTLGRDRSELDRFARLTRGHRQIDGPEIAALEPELEGRFSRALFFEDEAHLDPRGALAGLSDRLVHSGVRRQSGEPSADLMVDCRGLSARDRLSDLRGVRGEMAILRAPDVEINRPIRLLHPRHPLYIVPRGPGTYVLGATQIEGGARPHATVRSVMELLSSAFALHPAFGEAEILELGTDARPAFPDNLPRIRRRGGRIFVNGLFRHGFLLAPALARMTADLIETGQKPEVMDEDIGER